MNGAFGSTRMGHALARASSCALLGWVLSGCGGAATVDDEDEPENPADDDSADGDPAGDDDGPGPAEPGSAPGAMPIPKPGEDPIIGGDGSERPSCEPVSCVDKGFDCGKIPDGCGDIVDCGLCPEGHVCGAEAPNVCLDPETLGDPVPMADACAGKQCGSEGNGRGGSYDCGQCAEDEICGVLENFQCAPLRPPCTAASSCAELGWECGIAFDECGNTFDCAAEGRACNALQTCTGGLNAPTTCESSTTCDVCDAIADCSAEPMPTTLTGRVITAGRDDANVGNQVGVPNAFVYVLANNDPAALPEIAAGLPEGGTACDRCDGQDLGTVLASAGTDARGYFTLEGDVPVGVEFLLVTKVGKFRRAVPLTLPESAACTETPVDVVDTRLPRTMTDGVGVNIPRIAVSTGDIDAMECVLEKMGIAESEFGAGAESSAARVHLYGVDGAEMPEGNPPEADLHGDAARLDGYDMVVFDCQGGGYLNPPEAADLDHVRDYVNRGGRMFASHWSYRAIYDNVGAGAYAAATVYETGLAASATWITPLSNQSSGTGIISVGRPGANPAKIQNFADWMVNEGVTTAPAYQFDITDPRDMATAVGSASDEFVYRNRSSTAYIQQYAFNTPYGAPEDAVCGRTAFSAFHVSPAGGGSTTPFRGANFPGHCTNAAANDGVLTDQEKSLLYMIFDLGACVSEEPPEPPGCTPLDCTGRCGMVSDGCGGVVDCSCPNGQVCNASTGTCGLPQCNPSTCAAQSAECGYVADGCGNALDCGLCPTGEVCDPQSNQCMPECVPFEVSVACADSCGFVSDGCGDVIECPDCAGALSCFLGQCTDQTCMPQACPANLECGVVSDGCDGVANCGVCTPPETCGGGGVANMCGIPECNPLSCNAQPDIECGWTGNGCGQAIDCGDCPPGQVCGAGGPNQCDGCEPRTCAQANNQIPGTGQLCGQIGDGCGEAINCGPCPAGEICGAVSPNRCGPGQTCQPRNCQQQNAECGKVGNGCGGVVDCGPCPSGEVCGFETPFQCDAPPPCVPTTCEEEEAECGDIGDGCGERVSCGNCPAGHSCRNNVCVKNSGIF